MKSPLEELNDAREKKDTLSASLPRLREQVAKAKDTRQELADVLEREEQDHLVGLVAESVVATARAKHDAAVVAHRKAEATLRQAEADVTRLDAVIGRLADDAYKVRIAWYRDEQTRLARELQAVLEKAVLANDALHQHYLAAEAEFPQVVIRNGGSRLYPPAAGLTNLSWPEFRHNPHATHGGRFGGWCKRVADFINPPAPPAPRPRRLVISAETGQQNVDRLNAIVQAEGLNPGNPADKAKIDKHIDRLNREAEAQAQQPPQPAAR
jgi:hypothetical protein